MCTKQNKNTVQNGHNFKFCPVLKYLQNFHADSVTPIRLIVKKKKSTYCRKSTKKHFECCSSAYILTESGGQRVKKTL